MSFRIVVIIIFISCKSFAQVWCTPNSEWYFTHNMFQGYSGYLKHKYLYDTIIDGKFCNKIHVEGELWQILFPQLYHYNYFIYTFTNNRVVYLKDVKELGANNFDTLYNFNATIGSKWRMAPVSQTGCAISHVTVLDTGSKIIQGIRLKWLKVNYKNSTPGQMYNIPNVNDTIYERFGGLMMYPYSPGNICPWTWDLNYGGQLRCYYDLDISYQSTASPELWNNQCDYYYVGIKENSSNIKFLSIYPNPSKDLIRLESSPDLLNCRITDLSGRTIFAQFKEDNKKFEIDISQLDKGLYILIFEDRSHRLYTGKFLKE